MQAVIRPFAAAGAAVLLTLSLAACGGGGAPTDASAEEFCGTGNELDEFDKIAEGDYEGFVEAADEAAQKFGEVGTPEDIPEEAREGFEIFIEALGSLEAGEVEERVGKATEDAESGGDLDPAALVSTLLGIEEGDQDAIGAFTEYSSETCSG